MAIRKKLQKRKKVKQEKAKQESFTNLSEDEARTLVNSLIASRKARDAINTIQRLPFADTPAFLLLKARAYALRALQLENKGLRQESEAVLDLLTTQLEPLAPLSCCDLAQVLGEAPLRFALRHYDSHALGHPQCSEVERVLAYRMVLENDWTFLDEMPPDSPFRKDGLVMAEAMPELDAARWQKAVDRLESFSRKSPFAPWKLFAKAMASAYGGEQVDLERALKALPPDFPLRRADSARKGVRGSDRFARVGPRQ